MESPPTPTTPLHRRRLDYGAVTVLEALVGMWLFLSPWILGVYHRDGALWNGMVLGALVIVGSLASAAAVSATTTVLSDRHHWWGWASIAIGAWLVVSPFLLGYHDSGAALTNSVLVGITLAALGWAAMDFAVRHMRTRDAG